MRVRGATCRIKGCKYPPRVAGRCKKHAAAECDRLFSLQVRSGGVCEADDGRPHKGNLQCAHGFSRSYTATRWDRRQCFCLCAGHHLYYTLHPIEWTRWMKARMGDALYDEIEALALTHQTPDLEVVLAQLKALA